MSDHVHDEANQVYDQDIRRHLAEEHGCHDAYKPGSYRSLVSLHNRQYHPDHHVTDARLGTMLPQGEK